ncbi:MAG: DUF3185 family protein [Spirochaetaceae bacterium]|nr:MAG: DUF3185 family protein [Spirochaetaceae bacterium]
MTNSKIAGIVLLVVGGILVYFGYQASQSVGDQLVRTFSGRFRDETMWFFIGGAAAVVAGAFLTFFRK